MPNGGNGELEGTTFNVYVYVVKEGNPVGPRDVMRGANLSSPSVAYRHLQKLETLGLLQKNELGRYIVKEKANISGHIWMGRNLVPRLMFYSFFFLGIFGAEIAIIAIRLFVYGLVPETVFVYLTSITAVAMALFFVEGILLYIKAKPN